MEQTTLYKKSKWLTSDIFSMEKQIFQKGNKSQGDLKKSNLLAKIAQKFYLFIFICSNKLKQAVVIIKGANCEQFFKAKYNF